MAIKQRLANNWRTFRWASWLGWQMEANWTNWYLFIIYSIAKPIAGTLIIVVMYLIVFGGVTGDPTFFSYMYLGNAFYIFIGQALFGTTWVIHEDREHYQTLKQVYMAPISLFIYLIGRATAKIAVAGMAVIITLAFGMLALGLPLALLNIDWALLALALLIGLLCMVSIGVALAGITFLTAKHGYGINEGVAGMFYLFCGAIFPLTILPDWGQAVGQAIPITYWLEITRRAMLPGSGISTISGLGDYSNIQILSFLLLSAAIFLVLSIGIFKYADYLARKKGKLDMSTSY
ncbi:MAG: ABC transporter permease [Methanomassiliicoccales archaeon]|jgi:ABC-2 type transport system permease protein